MWTLLLGLLLSKIVWASDVCTERVIYGSRFWGSNMAPTKPVVKRRSGQLEHQMLIRAMEPEDEDIVMNLAYSRLLITQCYDMMLKNIQRWSFHVTLGLVCYTHYTVFHNVWTALATGLLAYPLFLFVLARWILLPLDVYLSGDGGDFRNGMYEHWARQEAGSRALWVAEYDGKVVGLIAYMRVSQDVAEVQRIATNEKYEKKGIGASMMSHLENYCREQGYKELKMQVVETALPCRILCIRRGFDVDKVQDGFYYFYSLYHLSLKLNNFKSDKRRRRKKNWDNVL